VQLVLNDKGRVEVNSQLGSGVDRIEGTLTAQDADTYTLAVTDVYQITGSSSKWNGEIVKVAKDGTAGYKIHRFNKTRTLILVAAITAAAVVFLLTTGLAGGGSSSDTPPPGQTGQGH
jgi:hypothetical protein